MNRPVLSSDRRYVFDASPATVWSAIEQVDDYRNWWPWLERLDDPGLWPGAEWRCVIRSPLRRTLRFTITLDVVEAPGRIVAHLAGDLVGPAEVTVGALRAGRPERAEVRLVSELVPGDPVLAAITRLARPVARRAHDAVVDRGARQFAAALR